MEGCPDAASSRSIRVYLCQACGDVRTVAAAPAIQIKTQSFRLTPFTNVILEDEDHTHQITESDDALVPKREQSVARFALA